MISSILNTNRVLTKKLVKYSNNLISRKKTLFFTIFADTVRELLTHVPASVKSEQPTNPNYAIERSLATESNLTALHLAAFSGSENVVRTLLNSSGVDVEGASSPAVSLNYYCSLLG